MTEQCGAVFNSYGVPHSCVKDAGHIGRHTTDSEDRDNYGIKWNDEENLAALESRLAATEHAAESLNAALGRANDRAKDAEAALSEARAALRSAEMLLIEGCRLLSLVHPRKKSMGFLAQETTWQREIATHHSALSRPATETATWHIKGINNRGEHPTSYVATYFEVGIPSRIISALLREDLEWVIEQHKQARRVPGLVKALDNMAKAYLNMRDYHSEDTDVLYQVQNEQYLQDALVLIDAEVTK